jgi:hypothetical protein
MKNNKNTDNHICLDDEYSDTAENELNDPFLAEIHAIRQELYEETKHMNSEELTNHIRQSVAAVEKKLGITPVSRVTQPKTNVVIKKIS